MVERYPGANGRSEYGGGDGLQRLPDGESLGLPEIASATGDRARLMRQAGLHDFDPARDDLVGLAATALDPAQMSSAEREAYLMDLELSRKRMAERARLSELTNGYIEESDQYTGESGEGNGVASLDS